MNEVPVNAKDLGHQLNRSKGYIFAMKAAGYVFSHGNRTLPSHALAWLADHPGFRCTEYHRGTEAHHKHLPRPQLPGVGKFGELGYLND